MPVALRYKHFSTRGGILESVAIIKFIPPGVSSANSFLFSIGGERRKGKEKKEEKHVPPSYYVYTCAPMRPSLASAHRYKINAFNPKLPSLAGDEQQPAG